jgi:uncharacterized protein YbaP (TraB family)
MVWLGMLGVVLRPGVEPFVVAHARAEARVINYLETAIEFSRFMDMVSDAEYQKSFRLTLATDAPMRIKHSRDLYAAWIGGRVDAVMAVLERSPLAQLLEVQDVVFHQRHLLWLPRIIDTLRCDKRTLILVGAGHLGGPTGVLALLRDAGVEYQLLL